MSPFVRDYFDYNRHFNLSLKVRKQYQGKAQTQMKNRTRPGDKG